VHKEFLWERTSCRKERKHSICHTFIVQYRGCYRNSRWRHHQNRICLKH